MPVYEKPVPEKCQAPSHLDCVNSNKTLVELKVFYESPLAYSDTVICLCESCFSAHGLGKFGKKIRNLSPKYELNEDGQWTAVQSVPSEEELNRQKEKVENSFFVKLKKVIRRIPFVADLVSCYFCAIDPQTPMQVKATLYGVLLYFISPVDLIPDIIPGAGYLDDWGVVIAAIKILSSFITDEHRLAAKHWLENKKREDCTCLYCKKL